MNILILGNGGRENALARKALKSPLSNKVYVVPGNTGMDKELIVKDFDAENFDLVFDFCKKENIELIIVGNERYLEIGVVDYFDKTDIKIWGPTKQGAKIESSKDFAKYIMNKYNVPTAAHHTFATVRPALEFLDTQSFPVVIKQDGLALGKGVLVTSSYDEAKQFIIDSFETNDKVIFEEFLDGEEFSLLCFVNGENYVPMQPARDYKRAFDNDEGLNTGGMGCFTPVPSVTQSDLDFCYKEVIEKTVKGLSDENIHYKGILYAGLIQTKEGLKVIEFNARFGDPETEVLMEAMNADLVQVILDMLDNKVPEISWDNSPVVGVCLATKGYPSSYRKGYDVSINSGIDYYSMALKDNNGSLVTNGGRVMFVYSKGENFEEARKNVYEKVSKVKSDGLFYRTDICKDF
ncbi:MAG: phosphoribosylamine--glycine ligase [Lachnospirales bacterium]